MIIATDHKPNFTQVISIEPDEMSDFCRRFELAKINLSELEPISQQENSKHNLLGVRVGYDAFYPEQYYQCDSFEKVNPIRRKDLPVDKHLQNVQHYVILRHGERYELF